MSSGNECTDGDKIGNVVAKVGETILQPTPPVAGVKDAFQLFQLLPDPLEKKFLAWYMLTKHPERMNEKEFADFVRENTVNNELLLVPSHEFNVKFKSEHGIDIRGWYEKYCVGGKKRLHVKTCTTPTGGGEIKKIKSKNNSWKYGSKQKCRVCKEEDKTDRCHDCRPTIENVVRLINEILDRDFKSVKSMYYRIACMVEDDEAATSSSSSSSDQEHEGGGETNRLPTASSETNTKVRDELIRKAIMKCGLKFDQDGKLIL